MDLMRRDGGGARRHFSEMPLESAVLPTPRSESLVGGFTCRRLGARSGGRSEDRPAFAADASSQSALGPFEAGRGVRHSGFARETRDQLFERGIEKELLQ
jgi:hypothetical protein